MPDEVHFEVFYRAAGRSNWTLHDICPKRDDAIKRATKLAAGKPESGARVVKQTYDPKTSDYFSLTIFEAGRTSLTLAPKAEDLPPAARCTKPEDLYSDDARRVIARLLSDYLTRQRLTVTELLHRADALQVFETTDAVFGHAVQRIAVVQSANSDESVQDIIKDINTLLTEAMQRVYHDEERHYFPDVAPGEFGALATAVAQQADGSYVFNGALARRLKPAASWEGKLLRLLDVLDEAPAEEPGRTFLFKSVDLTAEEIMNGSSSLYELIGGRENLNMALHVLIDLLHQTDQTGHPGLIALTQRFAAGRLPRTRRAIANRVLAELKSNKRLCPTAIDDEIRAQRRIASCLMASAGKHFDPEDLAAAFTARSRLLVTDKALNEIIANAETPDEKTDRLLSVLDNIVGTENKRRLSAFLIPIISSSSFENHYLTSIQSPAAVLKQLAGHQARVLQSAFTKAQREDIASLFDRISVHVEARRNVFKDIEAKSSNPVDKAIYFLNLCNGGVTQGRLADRARKAALRYVSQPNFMAGFAARLQRPGGANAPDAQAELAVALKKAGIDPERALASAA